MTLNPHNGVGSLDPHRGRRVGPKVDESRSIVYADHPDFAGDTRAQDAYEFARDNGYWAIELGTINRNYGPLSVHESNFSIFGRGTGDQFESVYVEDLVVGASRGHLSGLCAIEEDNDHAIHIDGAFSMSLTNVGADGSDPNLFVENATGLRITGGSRLDVLLDEDTEQTIVDALSRSTVTDNGTDNTIGSVSPP